MRTVRSWFVAIGVVSVLTIAVSSALAGGNPPGNNGTVKVDGFALNGGNDPHVDCAFQIEFFGFDQGDLTGTATFVLQPPTGSGVLWVDQAFIGEDPAGGGNDLDASLAVDLLGPVVASGASPQPNQGFHVKLTVHAQGSVGADLKHKTFWVTCGGEGEGG